MLNIVECTAFMAAIVALLMWQEARREAKR